MPSEIENSVMSSRFQWVYPRFQCSNRDSSGIGNWQLVSELINHREPLNRFQPSEIKPNEHSLDQNGFFRDN
jgi:hypothetical protein